MKRNVLLLCIIVFWGCSSAFAQTWSGKVLDVRDGDLISIMHPEKGAVTMMLYGIDAPDRGQPFFKEAKEFLTDRVEGKIVSVRVIPSEQKIDTVIIIHEGANINEEILAAGFCWVYDKYCEQGFCSEWKNYEKQARKRKVGLWQDENPIPPYEWRQKVLTKIFRVFLWIIPPWSD